MGPWPDERFAVWRPVTRYACGGGANLASDAAFDAQRRLAERVLLWYRQYPDLLRKLSKRAPAVVDLFCGGGGCSEGIRRAGMTTCGLGSEMQEDYVRRFGDDAFTQTDALVADEVRRAIAQVGAIGVGSSPPCKSHSTAPIAAGQASSAPPMIRQTHEMLTTLGASLFDLGGKRAGSRCGFHRRFVRGAPWFHVWSARRSGAQILDQLRGTRGRGSRDRRQAASGRCLPRRTPAFLAT